MDSGSLLDHLETASISNQLLRREVQMWTEKHATVTEQLNKAKENLQKKGDVWKREQAEVSKLDSLAKVCRFLILCIILLMIYVYQVE